MNSQFGAASVVSLSQYACDALVLVVPATGAVADAAVAGLLEQLVKAGDMKRKAGEALVLNSPPAFKAARVALAVAANDSHKAFRKALGAALGLLKGRSLKHIAVSAVAGGGAAHAECVVACVEATYYCYTHTKPSATAAPEPDKVTLLVAKENLALARQGLARGEGIAQGVRLARECANLPANLCTPTHLGQEAKRIGKLGGMKVQVLDQKAVEKIGMGSFLSVAAGSDEPLRFIIMEYSGATKKGEPPIVLVGKGITFDTGGISLKPGADMDEMKFDMGGAASVLGAMRAVAALKPKVNVVALIPACENMPNGRATKPGDVVKSLSGQTIEILNTDAEGRLILCDALTYAERYKPQVVVDVATLTGACVIALGNEHAGMYATSDELAGELSRAGHAALDTCWRMPLDEEYAEGLKSNFADMPNIAGRAGGSITAAKFLQKFVGKMPWAHLDIAGVAYKTGSAKGSTGRPVGLLTHFILGRAGR